MLTFEDPKSPAIIKVVGVGGAGMNAVERMLALDLKGVEIIVMNTDEQDLNKSSASHKIQLGAKVTGGMGAGSKPEVGAQAAIEDRDKIANVLKDADMIFIAAGMGGGTGTGAAPIVAEVAREMNALTVGVVTLPFKHEGNLKTEVAREGQAKLREKVDTLISVPNDAIFKVVERNTPIDMAFKAIDDILARSVIGISDIINTTGKLNVDFADVKTIMSGTGDAVIGVGEGSGETRVQDAIKNAIQHPLLEGKSVEGAHAILLNIVAGGELSIFEYNEILGSINEKISPRAKVIVGMREEPGETQRVSLTVIATGFKNQVKQEKNLVELKKTGTEGNQIHLLSKTNRPQENNEYSSDVEVPNGELFEAQDNYTDSFPNLLSDINIPTYLRNRNR